MPPYGYVPGRAPHPVSDPAGHSYGIAPERPPPLDPARWHDSPLYRFGIDLFNHGYYWEAHEAWEALWHAAGRRGPVADFLKALIQLAAAGVKVRQGQPEGTRTHTARARELLAGVAQSLNAESFAGLRLSDLTLCCNAAYDRAGHASPDSEQVVFPFVLMPIRR